MSLPKSFPIKVADGKTSAIPSVGFGTWASDGSSPTSPADPVWIIDGLAFALDVGYRHLDGAWFYGVDREIGAGIRKSSVPRSELFVSSKIWPNFYHSAAVEVGCDKILEGMGVEYLDLLLMHWPHAWEPISLEYLKEADASNAASMEKKGMKMTSDGEFVIDWQHTSEPIAIAGGHPEGCSVPTWNAMKELVKKGKVRAIGVSNFGIKDLEALLPHAQDVPISTNQIEAHPWFPNNDLVNFGRKHGIITTCFSPFAGQKADGKTLIQDPTVEQLAKRNDMGVDRIRGNIDVRRLSDEDIKALDDLEIPNGEGRTIDFTEAWGIKLWQN